jgi:GNAT superfamily N-acetyltransferase
MSAGMSAGVGPGLPVAVHADQLTYRPARIDELAACAEIWRIATNDYTARLGQYEQPDMSDRLVHLYNHLRNSNPELFVVAAQPSADGAERIVAFAAAVRREQVWFLSMLFVLPEFQGARVGRRLLEEVLPRDPGAFRATGTDSAQPVSNALYSSFGIVPRIPLFNLSGLPTRPDAFGSLPSGVTPIAFDDLRTRTSDGASRLAARIDALDRAALGAAHPVDHAYLATEPRRGWLYEGPDGEAVGYGYAGEAGRVGPIAVLDPDLVAPVIGHLTSAVVPRGAFMLWIPGSADRALVASLAAGFRLDQFPVLLCWDRPFADFARYLPISPGLL